MNLASLELWKNRIADQKASGLNVGDWCEKNNLSVHAYYYWRKCIETASQNKPATNKALFAELNPSPEPISDIKAQLQISWRDFKISITNVDTARLAAEFISQLQKRC
jgi:transposase-like protein